MQMDWKSRTKKVDNHQFINIILLKTILERTDGYIEEEEIWWGNFFENFEEESLEQRLTRDEGSPYLYYMNNTLKICEEHMEIPSSAYLELHLQ